jgi:hypothetical protein
LFAAVAGYTKHLQITSVICSTKGHRYDVIDRWFVAQSLSTACAAMPLRFEDHHNIVVTVGTSRSQPMLTLALVFSFDRLAMRGRLVKAPIFEHTQPIYSAVALCVLAADMRFVCVIFPALGSKLT